MKKLLLLFACVAFMCAANAQGQGRRDPEQMKQMMKDRLKEELKFSDQLTDSIIAVTFEFQGETRKIRQDAGFTEDEKAAAIKKINDQRDAKLKTFLTPEQFASLQAYNEKMRKMREERQKNQ